MQITCNVNQTEAIRRGYDTNSTVKLEVNPADLSQEQRDTLASKFRAGVFDDYSRPLSEPTLKGLKESLDACGTAEKEVAAKAFAALQEAWAKFDEDPLSMMYFTDHYNTVSLSGRLRYEEITNERRAICDNVQTERRHKYELELADKKKEEAATALSRAAQAAKRKEAEDNFRDWALQNGSPTLQLRIKEGYSWLPTAADEYVDGLLVVAGVDASQQVYDTDDDTDVNRAVAPSLSEMQALCDVREALLKVLPVDKFELQLCNVTYTSKEFGEYGEEDDQITRQVELKVCIDTPTGGTVTRFYKV